MVKRFEAQSESLTEATRHLTEVNRQIETTVEERRPALENLAAGLRARSEELDGMMRSFTRIISETLKTAEERATAVSRMLTENTASATKGVIDNFENLSRTAGAESRKAAETVREANRALIEEISASVAEAAKHFAEATREMRAATKDLQHDLDETRNEIKKGVLELPEEARESSESMRRVIGDQIQALSELSEIIARHGKTLDISSPALGERQVSRQIEAPVMATAVGGEAAAAWSDGAAASRAGVGGGTRPITSRPEPVRAPPQPPRPVPARPTPAPAAVATPVAPAAAPQGEAASEGWVSDLLRRASRDEEAGDSEAPAKIETAAAPRAELNGNGAAAPAAKVDADQPLGALSVDIAKAIDHEASVELWERHRRGEQNVFTRRLYTLQGQQTFDEIRKKYQRDAKFRAAVDRYVGDFEKLLAEVKRKNGDNPTASNAYLVSDTGKVYTMLAHASGRFD